MFSALKLPATHEISGNTSALASIMPFIVFFNVFNVIVIAVALQNSAQSETIFTWAALSLTFYIGLLVRAFYLRRYKKRRKSPNKVKQRQIMARKAVVLSFLSALPWAIVSPFILITEPGKVHMLASNISVGMATSGCVLLASIPRAAVVYMMTVLFPPSLVLFFAAQNPYAPFIALLGFSLMFFLYIVIGMTARVFKERTTISDELKFSKYQIEETNQEIRKLANLDTLTGLKNRQAFTYCVEEILRNFAQYSDSGCALFYVDMDDFALVNQRYGHVCGDQLIKQISKQLTELWHEDDVIARISGDEFAIIAPGVRSASEVDGLAQGLLAELRGNYAVMRYQIEVTVSIGAVFLSRNAVSATGLMRLADNAMEIAKRAGGDRYWIHDLDNLWSAVAPAESTAGLIKRLSKHSS